MFLPSIVHVLQLIPLVLMCNSVMHRDVWVGADPNEHRYIQLELPSAKTAKPGEKQLIHMVNSSKLSTPSRDLGKGVSAAERTINSSHGETNREISGLW